jgi:hypothetical protein
MSVADPIADIAILGPPDDQEYWEHTEAYKELVESTTPLAIADSLTKVAAGCCHWTACGFSAASRSSTMIRFGSLKRLNPSRMACPARPPFRTKVQRPGLFAWQRIPMIIKAMTVPVIRNWSGVSPVGFSEPKACEPATGCFRS